ncbi:histidine phosphatase family protein [Gordonia sp. CPCC 206044]|uniref:histidine phosphatase family protein n=1 Tax=Gordonia sp. CPCC 206044 TaxID=3140793 RepID=UPI003AF38AD9
MGVIYLVRHGQADPNAYGISDASEPAPNGPGGLTDTGTIQARLTGTLLASLTDRVSAAISGDLPRQTQTLARVLGQFTDAPEPIVDPGWNEYELPALVGSATTEEYRDGRAYQRRLDEGLLEWVEGGGEHGAGETFVGFAHRVSDAAARAQALAGSGQTVVAVSSAGTITRWIADLLGVPPERWPAMSRTMVNASVSKLIVGRRGVSVVSFNEHAHLADRDGGISTYR